MESQCLLYLFLEQKSNAFWVVQAIAISLLACIALGCITLGSSRCGDCIVKPLGYWMVNKNTISSAHNALLGCFIRRVRAKTEREREKPVLTVSNFRTEEQYLFGGPGDTNGFSSHKCIPKANKHNHDISGKFLSPFRPQTFMRNFRQSQKIFCNHFNEVCDSVKRI